ncbi:MAG: tetratricopeptide repeat protein [Candidatus Acidiferrales bacterium]
MAILLTGTTVAVHAQTPAPEPAYVARGHLAEVHQHALKERLDRFHAKASIQLQRDAPDLLPALEPPPPIAYGYQILPRIISDPPVGPLGKPHVVSFSWPWSDTLISREMTELEGLESDLAAASQKPAESRHAAYEAVVAGYKKAVDSRRVIDADVDYNWLWQRQIANSRAFFDLLTARLNAEVEKEQRPASPGTTPEALAIDFSPPEFVRVDASAGRLRIVTVPIYTDIQDSGVVESFRRAIESYWHVYDGPVEYQVRLSITAIPPEHLYCGTSDDGKAPAAACAPPAKGEHINLAAHVARFPADGAVLTTGAESLQVTAVRAIVLGPHDVAPRTLAHEFGHVLGFPDAYLRGYKDLGADGFQVEELVPNFEDIMSSPGAGSVLARHFRALIAAKEIQTLMQEGLDALYKQGDPSDAAARFREVLARNPDHYGATLQLAKALDRAGKPEEALPVWRRMLGMAEAAGDAETIQTVRTRLADAHQ